MGDREPMRLEEALAMRGSGWDGDLAEMRSHDRALELWLNPPSVGG